MDKTWKALERRVAKFFGASRTPLSGGNGKVTRADVIHKYLFIEAKQRKKQSLYTLYDNTKALAITENKVPVLAIHESGRKGFLIVVHSEELDEFYTLYQLYKEEIKF